MDGDREKMRRVFDRARRLPKAERTAFLDELDEVDGLMRARIEDMLDALDEAGPFLSAPTQNPGSVSPTVERSVDAVTLAAALHEGPGTRIGPYRLLQAIGEGGFGSVFMAEQEKPVSRKVALKVIKLGMDTHQVVARFEQERQALAMMDHPHIARVLDAGATETGRPFFVMELVKGDPIAEYCDKNSLSIENRLELFSQVCNAVQHAHTKGIIHRDLKSSNVLVSTQDGRPHAKVIDFGIAKATASKLTEKTLFTEHRQLIGTPEYMSPEQAEGSLDIDTRTDVYSLGVLLYELLTSTTPFSSKQLRSAAYAEIQRIIREVEPPKPSTRLSESSGTIGDIAQRRKTEPKRLGLIVRGELDWIVMKCLEKDRSCRYESAAALAEDVRRHLADEPVSAGPPQAGYVVRKFVRRHRGQVVAAGVLAGAMSLGIVGTSVGLMRAQERNRVVTEQRDTASAALTRVAQEARNRVAAENGPDTVAGIESLSGDEPVRALADVTVRLIERIDALRKAEAAQRAAAEQAATQARNSASEAEQNGRKAEVARDRADKIAGFLREILASADPTAEGAQVTLVDVLRKSNPMFEARLKGQPEAELELRETIGKTFANLGAHKDALLHQQRALELAARVVPPAEGAGPAARFEWLERWMQPVFKSCLWSGDAARVVAIANAAASELAVQRGESDVTVKLLREGAAALGPAIAASKGTLGPRAGQPAPSREESRVDLARKRLKQKEDLHGAADARTIDAMFELASALTAPAEAEEAESVYSAASAAEAKLRAIDDPARQRHQIQHAIFNASRREPKEAIAILQTALEEAERTAGPAKVENIEALRAIAEHQARLPDPNAQLKTLRAAMSIAQSKLGAAHPTTFIVRSELVRELGSAGQFAEAEQLLQECVDELAGASSPLLPVAKISLGHLLAARGRHAEVVEILRPVIAGMNRAPGPIDVQSFDPRQRYAGSLIELGKWDEAATELLWFAAEPEVVSDMPKSIRRLGARLWVRFYERRAVAEPGNGYEEQARRWRTVAKSPQPTGE